MHTVVYSLYLLNVGKELLSILRGTGHISVIEFFRGDISETNFKNGTFDVCVIIDALHHVPDFYKALTEMKRIGGSLILSEPNALNPIRRLNEMKYRNEDVKEISFYEWQLKKALLSLGYLNIKVYHQHFIPSFVSSRQLGFFLRFEPFIANVLSYVSGSLLMFGK